MRIGVIGAGSIGSAVAAAAATTGAKVTLIESSRPGAGTSGTTFAWINANNKQPRHYHDLNVAGLREHHTLAAHGAKAFHNQRHVEVAQTTEHAERLAAKLDRLSGWGYAATALDRHELSTAAPHLAPSTHGPLAAVYPDEGYCDVQALITEALERATQAGATLRVDTVVGLDAYRQHVDVQLRTGGRMTFDRVVIAAGRWSADLLETAGFHLPMHTTDAPGSATVGFLATTEPLPTGVDRVYTTSRLNVRPDGHGRLLLQALDLDAEADPTRRYMPDDAIGREMAARLAAILDLPYPAPIAHLKVGVRSLPADGLTVSGYIDPAHRIYVIISHSGITLAPLLGNLAAQELHGEDSHLLQPFRPERFAEGRPFIGPSPARSPGDQ